MSYFDAWVAPVGASFVAGGSTPDRWVPGVHDELVVPAIGQNFERELSAYRETLRASKDECIVYANRAMAALFGYEFHEVGEVGDTLGHAA